MSGRGKSRAKVHMSKPEPPPFLQRIRERIVANEDADRRERCEKKRKERPGKVEDPEDDPTVVKLNDSDLTEEEYKRMKLELETQYKLDDERKSAPVREELDVDTLIGSRQRGGGDGGKIEKVSRDGQDRRQSGTSGKGGCGRPNVAATNKTLSYGSSSDDEE